jgi:hypothetical protein
MLDAIGMLEDEGPQRPGSAPTKWTLRWFDPAEIQGKPRSWTGPAPAGATWGSTVRAVAASGPRALFTIRAGGKNLVVRVKPAGGIETAEVAWELLPGAEVAFGEGRGDPIAWLHDTALVVWLSGEAPRAIATVSTHATRTLGAPTPAGVPLLLGAADWSLARTVPIPAPPKPGGAAPLAPIPLDGWSPAPNLRTDLARLPACAARPRGDRFLVQRTTGEAAIDGQRELAQGVVYDVRVAAGDASSAGVTALLFPDRARPAPPPPKGAPPPPLATGPVAFLRADLIGKRAEGGERGTDARAGFRRLACTLSPRR